MPQLSTEAQQPPPQKAKKRKRDKGKNGKKKAKKTKTATNGRTNAHNGIAVESSTSSTGNSSSSSSGGSNNDNFDATFARIAERRQKEVSMLEPALVWGLLIDIRELTGTELSSLAAAKSAPSTSLSFGVNAKEAAYDVKRLIVNEYKTLSDESVVPGKRRKSWETVRDVFHLIDTLTGTDNDDEDDAEPNAKTTGESSATDSLRQVADKGRKTTGENQKSSSGNATASERPATPSSTSTVATAATTNSTTSMNPEPQKSATSTGSKKSSAAEGITSASKTVSKGNTSSTSPSLKSKKPLRTVASLSLASALTTATAAESNNPATINKDPPVHPSMPRGLTPSPTMNHPTVPPGAVPPPYQKHSQTAQQHKTQKLQKQQQPQRKKLQDGIHPAMRGNHNTATNASHQAPKTSAPTTARKGIAPNANSKQTNVSAGKAAAMKRSASAPPKPNNVPSSPPPVDFPAAGAASIVSASSSMTSTEVSPSRNTDVNNKVVAKALKIQFEDPVTEVNEKPVDAGVITSITLPPDESKTKPTPYSCYVEDRPQVELQFKSNFPTPNMGKSFVKRLSRWDPYWIPEKIFVSGLTAPVTKYRYQNQNKGSKYTSQTAAQFAMRDVLKIAGPRIRQNNGEAPKDNDLRVLIRMLPLYLSKQKHGGKDRADVHLWPKGTYLQIRADSDIRSIGTPQILCQRKQQSHDASKWLGICKHLDVTNIIHNAWSSSSSSLKSKKSKRTEIQLGCYDPELYMFSLALCRYQAPSSLSKTLLENPQLLRRVSIEEMHQRAKKLMESNEVILDGDTDDDDDENKPAELRSIRFSIRDPLTMAALKTPVRGKGCLHFSCFELDSFLDLNKNSSGQRWKCGYCENFLSHEDLEYCSLTKQASERFGNKITPLQHMVEFREDGSMALCRAVRSHQERTRARKQAAEAANPQGEGGGDDNEIVELLDSDSD